MERLGSAERVRAIAKIAAELQWLKRKVEATGAKLVVVYIPPRDALIERGSRSPEVIAQDELDERLSRETKQARIPFLDLTPTIAAKMRRQPKSLYFEHDDHMRPEGYRLVGQEVARFLAESGTSLGL